jgi:putative ABC transport system permease protein
LNVKPGFEPAGLLAADVLTLSKNYPDAARRAAFFRAVRERVAAVPGVESVGAVDPLPLGGNSNAFNFRIEGWPPVAPEDEPVSDARSATPDYFRAMGIPLVAGRAFDERDAKDSPGVIVINQTFARRFFAGEDPLGRRVITDDTAAGGAREVVGVVGDVRHAGLEEDVTPEYYVPYAQLTPPRMSFVIRARGGADASALAPAVREAIRQLDREQPVYNVRTMNQLLAESVARRRFQMTLLALFASLALFLAGVGIYGVMSYTVAQRTHEIGVRVALGAQGRDVLRLVVGRGVRLAALGLLFGVGASLALTRLMSSLLFGVSAADPAVYAAVSLLLFAVALAACLVPARRATKVDPMEALRYE